MTGKSSSLISERLVDRNRLLGSATSLLTVLSNPLNVTLLTSQLLIAPALWHGPSAVRTAFQLLGVFNTASIHLVQRDRGYSDGVPNTAPEGLQIEKWVKSIVKGADDKSPRWRHLLVLGGVLIGFDKYGERNLPSELRHNLEAAVVTAANLALKDEQHNSEDALHVVGLVLAHIFDFLEEFQKSRLDHERLLPLLVDAIFFSRDGFQWGYFVGTMDADLLQVTGEKFLWSPKSSTYFQTQRIASSPLIGALGPLSRVVAYCVGAVSRIDAILQTADSLQRFSRSVSVQWQQNKLSEVDPAEESLFLHEDTLTKTIPTLWQLLKSALFSTVVVQSAIVGRLLSDRQIPHKQQPLLAIQTLHTLRNLYFITVRLGGQLFSQHTFVYTGAIDILSKYPTQAEVFLQDIRPDEFGQIPLHPYARLLDLFFLNTAENFTLELPLETNRDLLLGAAAAYSGAGHDTRLVDIFEAAHSVTLAVFSAPQNHSLTIATLPIYLNTLFRVFPISLSARQFRLAIKTCVQVAYAPGPVSAADPLLGPTIMELVFSRALTAPATPLPKLPRQQVAAIAEPPMSEQSALVLTLIDTLPALSIAALEEWLPLVADAMNAIADEGLKISCRQRFWELLNNGELDVARAQLCVMWWTTRSGREMVLHGLRSGPQTEQRVTAGDTYEPLMSGALPDSRVEKL